MTTGAIRIRGLSWRPLGRPTPVVSDLDLSIDPGERVLIVGASGAGKSTILHAVAGALGTTLAGDRSGTVEVGGRIGLVLQNPADAVVAEGIGRDVAFGLENHGVAPTDIWPQVDAALAGVGLTYGRHHLVASLSGGELQRLVLAGVLAGRPDILLLDEPTSMLDPVAAAAGRDAVLAAVGDRTMVVVEHRFGPWLDHIERVVVLDRNGTVVSDGSTADFRTGPTPPGVWMPGMPTPTPRVLPAEVVAPALMTERLVAEDVAVTLTTRTLRGTQRTAALRGFSAAFAPGRLAAIAGPSGSGKSTALAALGGLQTVGGGAVRPDRRAATSRELAMSVGWVPQNPEHGFLAHTVRNEVAYTARRLGRDVEVDAVLDALNLDQVAEAHPFRLSGGEQRRLALAAGLAHRPGTLLLDEPTVGQDPDTWAAVVGWLKSAAAAGAVVVAATHDDELPADDLVRLQAGVSE